jgi:GDP-L-fucose synthase
MKILLTGGFGMVGQNILENDQSNFFEFIYPNSDELNLLEKDLIFDYLSTHQPDFIIHAAGRVGGIQANISDPKSFFIDNLLMGVNLISAADALNFSKVLNLGSSCMYPKDIEETLSESMILQGQLEPTNEGYAIAKIAVSKLCEYISKDSVNRSYKTVIPCNLYGRYDHFDESRSHLIPAVIRKLYLAEQDGKKVVSIWGDGSARREFMSASDLADFIFFAIKNFDKLPQNINVGIGHDYSVKEYYEHIAKVVGYEGSFEYDLTKPQGMKRKLVDTRLLNEIGWEHKLSLHDGLLEAFEYFLSEME